MLWLSPIYALLAIHGKFDGDQKMRCSQVSHHNQLATTLPPCIAKWTILPLLFTLHAHSEKSRRTNATNYHYSNIRPILVDADVNILMHMAYVRMMVVLNSFNITNCKQLTLWVAEASMALFCLLGDDLTLPSLQSVLWPVSTGTRTSQQTVFSLKQMLGHDLALPSLQSVLWPVSTGTRTSQQTLFSLKQIALLSKCARTYFTWHAGDRQF